jgi:hypothetical protein
VNAIPSGRGRAPETGGQSVVACMGMCVDADGTRLVFRLEPPHLAGVPVRAVHREAPVPPGKEAAAREVAALA